MLPDFLICFWQQCTNVSVKLWTAPCSRLGSASLRQEKVAQSAQIETDECYGHVESEQFFNAIDNDGEAQNV